MARKPDEALLMAYLYDELDNPQREEVAAYLQAHPEVAEELNRLNETRQWLQKAPIHTPKEPFVVTGETSAFTTSNRVSHRVSNRVKNARLWQWWASVAAALLVMLIAGIWSNVRVSWKAKSLMISFADVPEPVAASINILELLQKPEAEKYIQNEVVKVVYAENDSLKQELNRLEQLVANRQVAPSGPTKIIKEEVDMRKIEDLIKNSQKENYRFILGLVEASNQKQRENMVQLTEQLIKKIHSQRKDDLDAIQTAYNNLLFSTNTRQEETDLILSQLISQMNYKEHNGYE
ncbi:hypothetical protein AAG747_19995 [Rapidithrix thailandica]|uniref:Anti-sigma factor n=1 Tax=Rapidithrix thailandica TaxID=413964 RepID=A0AAW9SCN0_9BACT